jgi:hypothetical protein
VAPQIWIDIVDGKNVSAETIATSCGAKGIDHAVRLFHLKAMPRGTNGKGNRQQLKTSMLAVAPATCNASVRPARNRDSTVRVNFDRLIMSRAGPLYQSVREARAFGHYLDVYNGRRTTLEP